MTRPAAPLSVVLPTPSNLDAELLAVVNGAADRELPALIGSFEAAKARAYARLIMPPVPATPETDDVVHDIAEVARLARHSISWVRKNGHRLPGFHQPGGKGTRVVWSRRALMAWATSPPDESPCRRTMHRA
jgi:hypothetical protein